MVREGKEPDSGPGEGLCELRLERKQENFSDSKGRTQWERIPKKGVKTGSPVLRDVEAGAIFGRLS